MELYIYDLDTNEVVAIAVGETTEECEDKAAPYTNDYGTTYSPAFGFANGLIENDEADIL